MGSFNGSIGYGYNYVNYTTGTTTVPVHIYKSTPATEGLYPILSPTRVAFLNLNPVCGVPVHAKTNANIYDTVQSGKSFHGIFYSNGILSKDGEVNITKDANKVTYDNGLADGYNGWWKYYPCICMTSSGSAAVHWFSLEGNAGGRITIADGMRKFATIIPGQHCLVFNGLNVFDETLPGYPFASYEGRTIVRVGDEANIENHYNVGLGGSVNGRRKRTLLGHVASDNSICLVVTVGDVAGPPALPGLKISDCAELMKDLGCDNALNMDGGGPSSMWCNGSQKYPVPATAVLGSVLCVHEKKTMIDPDGDGVLSNWDIACVQRNLGAIIGSGTSDDVRRCDINCDGVVDQADVSLVTNAYRNGNRFDINGDGRVDNADLSLAFNFYQSVITATSGPSAKRCDTDGDGVVTMVDVLSIYANLD